MQIENYRERESIRTYFSTYQTLRDQGVPSEKNQGLIMLRSLSIQVTPTTTNEDCASRALKAIGFPSDMNLEILQRNLIDLEQIGSLRPFEDCIALYYSIGVGDKDRFTNAALLDRRSHGKPIFTSKWDLTTLVAHPLEKVPSDFGDLVRLYRVDDHIKHIVQQQRLGIASYY